MTLEQKIVGTIFIVMIGIGFYFHWIFGIVALIIVGKIIKDNDIKFTNDDIPNSNDKTSICYSPSNKSNSSIDIIGNDEFDFEIVGEASYKKAIKSLIPNKYLDELDYVLYFTAHVILEDDNPYDKNAVCVQINDITVGYFSANDTKPYRKWASKNSIKSDATCLARVAGYKNLNFNIRLDTPFENKY